tara:strand:- start:1166 stop:2197 length:1032 start_codon:yes stop_codon:yes gene_type:complete
MSLADKNLTGEQIQQVLDLFLYKALEPIILNTDAFDVQVSYILALVSANRKRKPSSLPRDRTIELLCCFLVSENREEKFRLLREARLERSFLHAFASRFLREHSTYVSRYHKMLMVSGNTRFQIKHELDMESHLAGCKDRQGLYRIVTIGEAYLEKFYESRSKVLDHYVKLSSRQAKIYIKANGSNFDFHDVRQSILKSILLAIDKYDSNKGALTSYINWWVLNAQTCGTSEHEYGIAYTIPQSHRKKIAEKNTGFLNYSVSLDDMVTDDGNKNLHSVIGGKADVFEDFERSETENIVMYLAKHADTNGCARLVLDIGEHFTQDELSRMRQQTQEECPELTKV